MTRMTFCSIILGYFWWVCSLGFLGAYKQLRIPNHDQTTNHKRVQVSRKKDSMKIFVES